MADDPLQRLSGPWSIVSGLALLLFTIGAGTYVHSLMGAKEARLHWFFDVLLVWSCLASVGLIVWGWMHTKRGLDRFIGLPTIGTVAGVVAAVVSAVTLALVLISADVVADKQLKVTCAQASDAQLDSRQHAGRVVCEEVWGR